MSHMLSEVRRYVQIKQESHESTCKAMSKLRRSRGKLKVSADCWLSKYFCNFVCVVVGLTTVNKLEKLFTVILIFEIAKGMNTRIPGSDRRLLTEYIAICNYLIRRTQICTS